MWTSEGCEEACEILSNWREGGKYQEDKRRGEEYGDNFKEVKDSWDHRAFITLTLFTPLPYFFINARQIHTHEHPYTPLRPSVLQFFFFFFFISGLIPQLMNFNRPQSEHLSSVFLSPKVMDLNHLRVLRQLCARRARKVRMK